MTKNQHGGIRKGQGRKAEVKGTKRINVSLDPATIEKARKIGGGNNVSLGLRRAVNDTYPWTRNT